MNKRRINVRGIIWRDGKLLAVKHKRSDGSETDYWAIPGGGLDPHESLHAGVIRELIEETGIAAQAGPLLFVQQFNSKRADCAEELEFHFHITNTEDFAIIDLAKTTHGTEEISRIEFIDPRKEYILPRFISDIDIASYIHTAQPVYLFNELGE
jgi:8-oxo-dGTP pyrophosphatase MutT (NUDIX family)